MFDLPEVARKTAIRRWLFTALSTCSCSSHYATSNAKSVGQLVRTVDRAGIVSGRRPACFAVRIFWHWTRWWPPLCADWVVEFFPARLATNSQQSTFPANRTGSAGRRIRPGRVLAPAVMHHRKRPSRWPASCSPATPNFGASNTLSRFSIGGPASASSGDWELELLCHSHFPQRWTCRPKGWPSLCNKH